MRRLIVCFGVLAAALLVASAASATPGSGRLAVVAQVSFGCPGPAREGTPGCNPWRPFAGARFALATLGTDGSVVPGTRRVYVASAQGRALVMLAAGRYLLLPLAQPRARAGTPVRVRVRPGRATRAILRWQGYPQMV